MSNEIQPALSPDEWAAAKNTAYLRDVLRDCADSAMSFEGDDSLVKAMAVANAALRDDDSRKITRADVEALRLADERIRGEWDHPNNPETDELRNLAAKLAALLPPE